MSTSAATTGTAVVEILAEIIGEQPGSLQEQTLLAAHDWDSLASLEALAQLEARFGINLNLVAFNDARTVGDVVALVRTAESA